MGIYNINSDIRNFLTRGFITTTNKDLDAFRIVQDPTYLTFKVEFFFPETVRHPKDATSIRTNNFFSDNHLSNVLSHEGLLLPPRYNIDAAGRSDNTSPNNPSFVKTQNLGDYSFSDSAEDYLYSIGSVDKIGYLRSFKQFLYKLQKDAPWYFQKIGGADSLYKVTPEMNTRQDALLNFECLESVDMRMSMLADFYRQAVWDFERHREVLPYNMRTFRMRIHVMEMRHFNTTSGSLALLMSDKTGNAYENAVKNKITQQNSGFLKNFLIGDTNAAGNGTGTIEQRALESAFDAISIQTYELGLCEFDFFTQSPSYLEDLNVSDPQMASFKFGIKYGTVRKTAKYSFYEYLTDYLIRNSKFPTRKNSPFTTNSVDVGNPTVVPYYDPESPKSNLSGYDLKEEAAMLLAQDAYDWGVNPADLNPDSYMAIKKKKDELDVRNQEPNPQTRVGGILGKVLGAAESAIGTAINRVESKINKTLIGNVFDRIPSPAEASQALLGFFNPDLRLAMGGERSQPIYDPGNVSFDALNVDKTIAPDRLQPLSVDTNIGGSGLDPLSIDHTLTQSPLTPLSVDHTLSQSPLTPLPVDHTLTQSPLIPLTVDHTVTGGGFIPLPPETTLTQSPLIPLPIDTNVQGGGFDGLAVSTTIESDPFKKLKVDKTVKGGGFDQLTINSDVKQDPIVPNIVDSSIVNGDASTSIFTTYIDANINDGIAKNPMEKTILDNSIQGSGMDKITLKQTVENDKLEPPPPPSQLITKNANLTGVEVTKQLSAKSVNFEQPTAKPQISPKNVYKKI